MIRSRLPTASGSRVSPCSRCRRTVHRKAEGHVVDALRSFQGDSHSEKGQSTFIRFHQISSDFVTDLKEENLMKSDESSSDFIGFHQISSDLWFSIAVRDLGPSQLLRCQVGGWNHQS